LKTPIVLTLFNRPETTRRVLQSIRVARPERLLVVADGPRKDRPGEAELCRQTRALLDEVDWPCEILREFADTNLGCRRRMSSGLDWAFSHCEEAIVLEDDCLPHESFFPYCEELLARYRDDPEIMVISGTNFQFDADTTTDSYYFSRYPLIWGWATWSSAWRLYDLQMKNWPELRDGNWLEKLLRRRHAVQYWRHTFESAWKGFDTWDYALVFACWLHNGLAIHPRHNLVSNIGFNANATHTRDESSRFAGLPAYPMQWPLTHPTKRDRNYIADERIEAALFGGTLAQRFAAIRERLGQGRSGNV